MFVLSSIGSDRPLMFDFLPSWNMYLRQNSHSQTIPLTRSLPCFFAESANCSSDWVSTSFWCLWWVQAVRVQEEQEQEQGSRTLPSSPKTCDSLQMNSFSVAVTRVLERLQWSLVAWVVDLFGRCAWTENVCFKPIRDIGCLQKWSTILVLLPLPVNMGRDFKN